MGCLKEAVRLNRLSNEVWKEEYSKKNKRGFNSSFLMSLQQDIQQRRMQYEKE